MKPEDACPACGAEVKDHGARSAIQGQRMAQHSHCPECGKALIRYEGERGELGAWRLDDRFDDDAS